MSSLPIPIARRLPFAGMAGQMRPLVHQLVEAAVAGCPGLSDRMRVLEAGSSGGLLSALALETPLVERVVSVDFADVAPDTLEGAVERSEGWPCRCHFINGGVENIAVTTGYDLIFTWGLFSRPGGEEHVARAVAARQKPGGLLLQFHDLSDMNRLGFALHPYRLVAARSYAASAGREPKCASAWLLA